MGPVDSKVVFKPYWFMKQIKNHEGFTLIEMLVVMFIITTISTISITNFRKGQKQKELAIAADGVINAIRNAQNFTLASRQIQNSTCNQGKVPVAYIIEFSQSQAMNLYGIDKCSNVNSIESYRYPQNVRVQTNGYKIGSGSVSALQIKFSPPFGQMTVSESASANQGPFNNFTTSSIVIELSDASATKTISIDGVAGRIGE